LHAVAMGRMIESASVIASRTLAAGKRVILFSINDQIGRR